MLSLRKHPFLLALRRWGRFRAKERRSSTRNVTSGEERGETDVFAGYGMLKILSDCIIMHLIQYNYTMCLK